MIAPGSFDQAAASFGSSQTTGAQANSNGHIFWETQALLRDPKLATEAMEGGNSQLIKEGEVGIGALPGGRQDGEREGRIVVGSLIEQSIIFYLLWEHLFTWVIWQTKSRYLASLASHQETL